MTTKTEQAPQGVETRLGIVRGEAAALRAEAAKLADDQRLALYEGKPTEAVVKKRALVQSRIDELELLISELERRLPAEQRDQLIADLQAALAADAVEDQKVVESLARVKDVEIALDEAYKAHQSVIHQRDMTHGHSFMLGQRIRKHKLEHPTTWEGFDA